MKVEVVDAAQLVTRRIAKYSDLIYKYNTSI